MTTSSRILIIEDELPMRTVLSDLLTRQSHRVFVAADGESGLEKALAESPDLIVLDVMLPKLDGFALCAELRRVCRTTPVLMLTAKGRVEDRVHGLDSGADDYLVKPFSREEFLARVRALLRRCAGSLRPKGEITLGAVRLDFRTQRAWKGNTELHMTAKEFAMLHLMIAAGGEAISRDRFLDAVWGYTSFPTTRTIDRHIAGLREKIEDDPEHPRWIHTVFGIGYRMELPAPPESGSKLQNGNT